MRPISPVLGSQSLNYLVRKYNGDKYVKSYTCWNHVLCSQGENQCLVQA
ncbi:MAG: DUF4372 domain-containing protein [Bacteroides sp.]|nr:DUF4372 domain-containing protein [Bacteroides sp.]